MWAGNDSLSHSRACRWTCQAILAGADYLKIGWVSRAHSKDPNNHFVLGTVLYRPTEFAMQIDLKVDNMWGITHRVMQRLKKLPFSDGDNHKFLLLKDPNNPTVNIYKIPSDSFDYEEQEEDAAEVVDDDDSDDFD